MSTTTSEPPLAPWMATYEEPTREEVMDQPLPEVTPAKKEEWGWALDAVARANLRNRLDSWPPPVQETRETILDLLR